MAGGAAPDWASAAPDPKRPGDLGVGDVVVLDGAPYEVLAEPFLGMSGSSVFDAPQLFWRARVRRIGDAAGAAGYATWTVDEHVTVYGRR